MLLKVDPQAIEGRKITHIQDVLHAGGLAIYPTDTVYGAGCLLSAPMGTQRLMALKGRQKQAPFSLLFKDIAQMNSYVEPMSRELFRLMKQLLPGPFTIIMRARPKVRHQALGRRKTIGVRLSAHPIIGAVLADLEEPLLTTSLHDEADLIGYPNDAELIYARFKYQVEVVVNGGMVDVEPSTILDASEAGTPRVLRQGKGDVSQMLMDVGALSR